MQKNESQHQRSTNRKKIRTDCEQSARISGTTPSGCACAHPPEESLPIGGRHEKDKVKRSEPIANNRPESRGLHPVGALARTHRKKVSRLEDDTRKIKSKDPNRLRTIGPNLGNYTQWVRLHAPTGRKSPDWRTTRER